MAEQLNQYHLLTMEKLASDASHIARSKAISPSQRQQAKAEARCFKDIARNIRNQLRAGRSPSSGRAE